MTIREIRSTIFLYRLKLASVELRHAAHEFANSVARGAGAKKKLKNVEIEWKELEEKNKKKHLANASCYRRRRRSAPVAATAAFAMWA